MIFEPAIFAVVILAFLGVPTESPNDRLFAAIAKSEPNAVLAAVKTGASLRAVDRSRRTPLAAACQRLEASSEANSSERRQVLATLLTVAAKATNKSISDPINESDCGRIGSTLIVWATTETAVLAFGRSGGVLLDVRGWYPRDVRFHDFDRDRRNEFAFKMQMGRGTGLSSLSTFIYFFEGRQFADPITATESSIESTWFGFVARGGERLMVPPLVCEETIRFKDVDGDGIADRAEAVQRRWWGRRQDDGNPFLETGPLWFNIALKRTYGFGLGAVQQQLVRAWNRDPTAPTFVKASR